MVNWRVARALSFLVMIATICAVLGVAITLEDKVFGIISWKVLIVIGQVYLVWVFKSLLNF